SNFSKLGILIIPFRLKHRLGKYDDLDWWSNWEIKNFGKNVFKNLSPSPDYCSIIQIRDSEYFPERKDDSYYYPALMLVAFEDIK
ncbi:MAG: hypothetical protein AAGJ18_09155, partial [Bacteroidota bacterium]